MESKTRSETSDVRTAGSQERLVQPYDEYEYEDGCGECYDENEWCETCGNLGSIICRCGGDICVCANYGEYPCPDCG